MYFCGKKIIVKLKFMNAFEMEFINDMKRLSFRRYDVCNILGVTMPTLKSKLQNPDSITVGEVVKLKRKGFKLINLGL